MTKLLTALLFTLALFACDSDVEATEIPDAVRSAFERSYPTASDVEWEMDDENYTVEFDFNGEEFEMMYSPTGEPLELEED